MGAIVGLSMSIEACSGTESPGVARVSVEEAEKDPS